MYTHVLVSERVPEMGGEWSREAIFGSGGSQAYQGYISDTREKVLVQILTLIK